MKKSILSLVLALVLSLGCTAAWAAEGDVTDMTGNPVDQFTGVIWQETTASNKAAFLFGVESAITVEYFVNSKMAEKAAKDGKRPVYCISPFEKGWMAAFKGVSREQIINKLDAWYAANPKSLDKPVLSVIWNELIVPQLAAK